MILVPLGSTEEIGASALYVNLDGTGLLLDAGQDPNVDGVDGLPRLELLLKHPDWALDHVIVTHAHHDHMGALPVVLERFPHAAVHMTRPTRMLLDVLLPASARLQRRRLLESSTAAQPTFTEEQAAAASYLYNAHELDTDFALDGLKGGARVTGRFVHSGHVLGAAGLLLTVEGYDGPHRIFYTSDTSLRPQVILPGADYPDPPVDVLILETTLGADPDAEHVIRVDQERELGQSIARVLARGGTVLLPVFALGRSQEIVALVDRYKQEGVIAEDTPVYTTGSMRAMSDIYDKTRYSSPRNDPEFQVFGVHQKRLPRKTARENAALSEPSIHIASSGMLFEKTLSNRIAQRLVSNPQHGIFFVGYLKDDTPGYRLLEASLREPGAEVTLDKYKGPQPVHCEVKKFRLTGHSHRRDLIQVVEKTRPAEVVLVHGEAEARDWLADNIRFFYPDIDLYLPAEGEALHL